MKERNVWQWWKKFDFYIKKNLVKKNFKSFFFACYSKEIKLCEKKISNFIGVTCNVHNALYIPKFYVRKPNQTHRFHLKKKERNLIVRREKNISK